MEATPPSVDILGDNFTEIKMGTSCDNSGYVTVKATRHWTLRPRIMARSGVCLGMNKTHAVWRFGFSKGSECADAFGVHTPEYLWVVATRKMGKPSAMFQGVYIELPEHFKKILRWEP